ncbi:MAG: VOC family protein [Actinomycetota bacterium]
MSVTLGYVSYYVDDVEASLRFFVDAFGLEQRFITPEKDYGELVTGQTTLGFVSRELATDNLGAAGGFTPLDPTRPPVGATITLVTDDVPATAATAIGAGARSYTEPVEKPWGQTVAYLVDPNGILIEVATPVAGG